MTRPRRNIGRSTNAVRRGRNNRANENEQQRIHRNVMVRQRNNRARAIAFIRQNLNRAAFNYDPNAPYSTHRSVEIGTMSKICRYCKAFKFDKEPPGLCCANGKVKLPPLMPPPEPLRSYVTANTPLGRHFLANIQIYNSMFQMNSFGATKIIRDNFIPNFKVIFDYDVYK